MMHRLSGLTIPTDNPVDSIKSDLHNRGQLIRQGADEISTAYHLRNDPAVTNSQRASNYYLGLSHMADAAVNPALAEDQKDMEESPNRGAGETLGDLLTSLVPHLTERGVNKTQGALENRANPENSAAHRGFTAVIDQGKAGMGKNFDAKEVASSVSPIVQQEIQSNRALRERILDPKATPEETYDAFHEAVHNAQQHIDEAHLDALRNVKNQPVDMKPVLQAIDDLKKEGMEKYAPDDVNELESLKKRVASVDTLGELNGLRMYLNNQTSPSFKMSGVAVQRSANLDQALSAASSAVRNTYYDGLSNATGQDFKKLKQTESDLLTTREALENARVPLASKEVQFNRPMTGKQFIGHVAESVGDVTGAVLGHGDKKKIAQTLLRESPMTQTQADIRRFTKKIPESVPGTFDSGVQTPDRPRLPSKGTPETVTAETTPNPAPAGPTAPPQALQAGRSQGALPQAAPAAKGLPGNASNSNVGVPGSTYPKLNAETAVDRTRRPIYPKPEPPKTSPVHVTPEGEAHIQRPALKAPAPKVKAAKAKKIMGGN
jgi:hypothetical protein